MNDPSRVNHNIFLLSIIHFLDDVLILTIKIDCKFRLHTDESNPIRVLDLLLIILLLKQSLCPNGVLIVGRWCSIPCTEATETLDSVPILFIALLCNHCR